MPKVSVIIPVYNGERYIDRCIKGMSEQTFRDYEIIFVDDGSNDTTLEKLMRLKEDLPNVEVLPQLNSGPSIARNNGMDRAKGEYLVFFDVDDEPYRECLEYMVDEMDRHQLEVLICEYCFMSKRNVSSNAGFRKNEVMTGRDLIFSDLKVHTKNDLCLCWRMMYKHTFIRDLHAKFPDKIRYGEDTVFNIEVLRHAKRAMYSPKIVYAYEMDNPDSATSAPYKKFYEESILEQYQYRRLLANQNSNYDFDMYFYYLENICPQMIENQKRSGKGLDKKDLKRILEYPMFRDAFRYFGYRYHCKNWKDYVTYLLKKWKMYGVLELLYKRSDDLRMAE